MGLTWLSLIEQMFQGPDLQRHLWGSLGNLSSQISACSRLTCRAENFTASRCCTSLHFLAVIVEAVCDHLRGDR